MRRKRQQRKKSKTGKMILKSVMDLLENKPND
jgi:hypothetical protein